jgi:hypothetical protein
MENYEGTIEVRGNYGGGLYYLLQDLNDMVWTTRPSQFVWDDKCKIHFLHPVAENPTVFPTRQTGGAGYVPCTLEELAELIGNSVQHGCIQVVAKGHADIDDCDWYTESLYYDADRKEAFRTSMYKTDSFGLICATEYGSESGGYPDFRLLSSRYEVDTIDGRIERSLAINAEIARFRTEGA